MALFGFSYFKYSSEWRYKTSKEVSLSLGGTVGKGTIVLENPSQRSEMNLNYAYISVSISKGLPFGVAKSSFDDPSTGIGELACDRYFSDFEFPCGGWMLQLGGTTGVVAYDNMGPPNGAALTIFLFGNKPFAGVRCYGNFWGSTPGAGVGAAYVRYGLA